MNEATITTSHTPGPWRAEEISFRGGVNYRAWTVQGTRGIVAEIRYTGVHSRPISEDEANARLIAEAPAMYAWLKKHYEDEEGIGETDRPAYAELRAILARIDGSPK